MPVYRIRRNDHTREIEVPTIADALSRAGRIGARVDWPSSVQAAKAELDRVAERLGEAGLTVTRRDDAAVLLPDLAAWPGDTSGVLIRTSPRAPYALIAITAAEVEPLTHADAALAHLQPLIQAAAEPCDGCGAGPGEPCRPNCLPDLAPL